MKGCVANNLLQPRIVRLIVNSKSWVQWFRNWSKRNWKSLYTEGASRNVFLSFCLSVCKCLNNFLANLQRFFKFCDRSLKFIFYRSAEALEVFVLVLCSLVFDYQWYWSRAWRGGGVWFQAGNNDLTGSRLETLSLGIRVSPMLLLIQLFTSKEFQLLES